MNRTPLRNISKILVASLLFLSGCRAGEVEVSPEPQDTGLPPGTGVATVTPIISASPQTSEEPTESVEATPGETPLPTATLEPASPLPETIACPEFLCVWKIDQAGIELLSLNRQIETAYDYSPGTMRLLHGRFTGRGAGPANIAVTDLQVLDLNTGENLAIIAEEKIAEAVWAPNGQNLAYVQATPESYELHWLTDFGEDSLLASDVAFTFSVSPAGDRIAFTRESNYRIDGDPGVYVVDVSTGEEHRLSEADRAGTGSISDRPNWSPDATQIILQVSGTNNPPRLLRAATDGSSAAYLTFAASVEQGVNWEGLGSNLLWHPDGRHLIGQVYPGMLGEDPNRIVLLELDPTLEQFIAATTIFEGEGELLGWDEPGLSVWIRTPDLELQSISIY